MRIFLASVEEGSFTKASAKQNVSQPAATIVINQIEETIGEDLFQRNGSSRKAIVTPAGQKVAETFSRIVAGYDGELSGIATILKGERGTRTILIQSGLDSCIDPMGLQAINTLYQDDALTYEVVSRATILETIQNRKADLAVVDGALQDERYDYLQTGRYRLALLHPDRSASEQATWADVKGTCYYLSTLDPSVHRQVVQALRRASGDPDDLIEIGSLALLRKLQTVAPAPAILPDLLARPLAEELSMTCLEFQDSMIEAPLGILTQWGHLARLKTAGLREQEMFVQPKELRNA